MDAQDLKFQTRDEFQRKPIADKIIKLLKSDIDISPLVIDGNWGTGKTEFCHKLIHLFKEVDTHQIIYIDAFKNDHINEPLLTIVTEIIKLQPEDKHGELQNILVPVLKTTFKTVSKAVVAHVLKTDTDSIAEGYDKEIQKIADKAIDVSINSIIKDHIEADKNLNALKSAIESLAEKKQIVIFIDELDRCRPDFATSLLEVIKHTFDIENVQFVLITNMKQLKASVNHCYGNAVDAKSYLDKFIKYRIQLSEKVNKNHASIQYLAILLKKSKLVKDEFSYYNNSQREILEHIIETNSLSLREVESIVRNIEICHVVNKAIYSMSEYDGQVKLLAICLFVVRPDLAQDILQKRADAVAIANFLGKDTIDFSDENSDSDFYDKLTVLIGRDCKINSEEFTPPEYSFEWDHTLSTFNGTVEILTQTLSELSLN